MKRVSKLLLVDDDNKCLLLYRSNQHPYYPNDPDLPGGTVEINEESIDAVRRELMEETGITLTEKLEKLCESSNYDKGYTYYLYKASCEKRPNVNLSWEHDKYEWLTVEDFTKKASTAIDKYMHMVSNCLSDGF